MGCRRRFLHFAQQTRDCRPALFRPRPDAGTRSGVNDVSGHDLFFSTFGRFDAVASIQPGKSMAAVREMAAGDHVSYVELIYNPAIVDQTSLTTADPQFNAADFAGAFKRFAPEMPALIRTARAQVDRAESDAQAALGCKQQADSAACNVKMHYQGYAIRALPPAQVFRELALCFALADADPRFVGVNIVAPEDGPVAVRDYALHMRMFRFFEQHYPNVKTTLHAGELTLGVVPPAALRDHIRQAVEIGGAKRIGHGIDIIYETDAPDLLARMARDHIAVEINLTSNDSILHVTGAQHPLAVYRAAGVPVVISTDDEGVTRTDMTNEYQRAATEQKLRYTDLKDIARASLEYSFLPGNGIWADNKIGTLMASCKDKDSNAAANSAAPAAQDACMTYLAGSEKAQAEWRLEREFRVFEQRIGTQVF
jgi:adenosine deaminase